MIKTRAFGFLTLTVALTLVPAVPSSAIDAPKEQLSLDPALLVQSLPKVPKGLVYVASAKSAGTVSDFYVKPSSLEIKGDIRSVWMLQDLHKPLRDGTRSKIFMADFNCRKRTFSIFYIKAYAGRRATGKTILAGYPTTRPARPPQKSAHMMSLTYVCNL
ncbi:MAG: hypothetical protein GJ676_13330 [Rhodobacteraceae bacterium]|nr:hypothetical protein [Paracoccaceae bacterium]